MQKLVLCTGGFDPLHSGHLRYLKHARSLGDRLLVSVNSDAWLVRKKGRPFMPYTERVQLVAALEYVDEVISFDDSDDTANGAIFTCVTSKQYRSLVFANGGDRLHDNTPEQREWGHDRRLTFAYGIGGNTKANSSSWILKDWSAPKTRRNWGHYRTLYRGDGFMVKELVIDPYSSLSMQRHQHRSETWNLVSGTAHVLMSNRTVPEGCAKYDLAPQNPIDIPAGVWHQGVNNTSKPAHIVEVWKGPDLTESDIERWGGVVG